MSSAICPKCSTTRRWRGRGGWRCPGCDAERHRKRRGSTPRARRRNRDSERGAQDYCHSCERFWRRLGYRDASSAYCPPCDERWKAVRARHNALVDCSDDLLGIATDIRRAYERLEIASGAKRRRDFWSGV